MRPRTYGGYWLPSMAESPLRVVEERETRMSNRAERYAAQELGHSQAVDFREETMTNETKATHTPGPWTVEETGTMTGRWFEIHGRQDYYDDGSSQGIASTNTWMVKFGRDDDWQRTELSDEIEANAYLLAAAPDLLEACWRQLFWETSILDDREKAAALGLSPIEYPYSSGYMDGWLHEHIYGFVEAAIKKARGEL